MDFQLHTNFAYLANSKELSKCASSGCLTRFAVSDTARTKLAEVKKDVARRNRVTLR